MDEENINHGVFPGRNPNGKDFVAGTLPYEVVVEDGNHKPWVPTFEAQSSIPRATTERYNCVTQAHHNCVENTVMRDIELGRIPAAHVKWLKDNGYFDDNGKLNVSERFNAIRNGTIWNDPDGNNGNWVWKVCEDGRKLSGLIPARMLPDIPEMPNAEYYDPSCITPEMVAMGQEWMKRFGLPYEWVSNDESNGEILQDTVNYHLKQASLMVTRPGHEIVGVDHKNATYLTINDSYSPFIKDLAYTKVTDVMKVLVNYLPFKGESMVGYKKVGNPTTYVAVGNTLVPIADWKAFTDLGGSSESVIELSDEQFAKFLISSSVLFKSAN